MSDEFTPTYDPETGEVFDLPVFGDGQLPAIPFDPQAARMRDAKADAVIDYAKKVRDWPLLIEAIDVKIDDLIELVRWWDETVRNPGYQRNNSDLNYLSLAEAEQQSSFSQVQLTRIRKRLKDIPKFKAQIGGAAYKKALGEMGDSEIVQLSLSNEHYTPEEYIEAAREVMGGIDLDPASCAEANKVVKAVKFYTVRDDGLAKPWKGRVWLNPPYGDMTGKFVKKLCDSYAGGSVTAAIVLVNAHCTDTSWFKGLWDGFLCFTDHRINFYGDENRSGSTHGSVFVYFGPDQDHYIQMFSPFGPIVRRVVS